MATRTLVPSIPESCSVDEHLAFLPILFSIQKLGASEFESKKKVLEIQSPFVNVSILNPGFGGEHNSNKTPP